MTSRIQSFLGELKRRKVIRVAVAYVVVGVGIVEGVDIIGTPLGLPGWVIPALSLLVVAGFPISLVLAWALDLTPAGVQRTPDAGIQESASSPPQLVTTARWIGAGIVCLALATGAYWVFGRDRTPPPDVPWIAVFPLDDRTENAGLEYAGSLGADRIREGLTRVGDLRLIPSNRIDDALRNQGEEETTQTLARELGAQAFWTGHYASYGDSLTMRAEAVDVASGEQLFVVESSGPPADLPGILQRLQDRATGGAFLASSGWIEVRTLPRMPTFEAAQLFVRGQSLTDAGDFESALPPYRAAYEADTTFLQPLLSVAGTLINLRYWPQVEEVLDRLRSRASELSRRQRLSLEFLASIASGNRGEWLRLHRLLKEEDPDHYGGYSHAHVALLCGYPAEALKALEEVPEEARESQWLWYWEHLAWANHALGRHQDALDAAREGEARFPEFLLLPWREIQALVALNRLEEIGPLLTDLEAGEPDQYASPGWILWLVARDLARFGHQEKAIETADRAIDWLRTRDADGDSLGVVQGLLLARRPQEALDLVKPLVAADSTDVPLRGLLGIAFAMTGNPREAEDQAVWIEGLKRPHLFGEDTYWRAAILAHLGRPEEATRLLRRAMEEGITFEVLSSSAEFMPLWGHEAFEELLSPRG